MITAVRVFVGRLLVLSTSPSNIGLDSNYRFYSGFGGFLIELDCSEKIAVVSDSQCRHFVFFGFGNQIIDFAGSIQEGIMAVRMQMYEI